MKKLSLTILTLTLATASAQTADYSNVPTIIGDRYTVNADASYDEIFEMTRIIRDQGGVENGSVSTMHFVAGLQQADVQEAYVLKKDGRKVVVDKDHITVKDAPQTSGYADFGDNKVLQVLYPDVGVGDKLYVRFHMHSKALFPGRFSAFTEVAPLGYPYQETTVVDAPKSLKLVAKARGAMKLNQAEKGDRVVYTLTDGHDKYLPSEPRAECPCDYAGAASVSNFTDWADMARAYRERAADKAAVTPAIKTLATQLVGKKKGLEAVKAIDTWVRSNVRYVQVYLDAGGYVPHSAESILNNKYGDCKDYVTLTQALLKAVGIDSEPVLVGTMPRYQEIPVPGPEQFDHAILYVPSIDKYLDPTNRFAPLGAYQDALADKPVLRTTTGKLVKFPAQTTADSVLTETLDMVLQEDGTVTGQLEARSTGNVSSDMRGAFAGVSTDVYPQVVQNLLSGRKENGTGGMTRAPEFSDLGPADYTAKWSSPKLVSMDDVISLKMPAGATVNPFADLADGVALETRTTPRLTTPYTIHKISTLTLPASLKVTRLPKTVAGDNPALKYAVTYRQEGSKIVEDQMIAIKGTVVQPADYPAYRAGLLAAVKAATATILLEKK